MSSPAVTTMVPRLIVPGLLLCATASAAASGLLVHEETFNLRTQTLDCRNGARVGQPGGGVSGRDEDRAYEASPPDTVNRPGGPVALIAGQTTSESFDALTVTLWYRLAAAQPELMVPFSIQGIQLLLNKQGPEIRIENSVTAPRLLQFTPGVKGPWLNWREPDAWLFLAFSWDRQTNTLRIYQGTDRQAVQLMRDMTRPVPTTPSLPRDDIDRNPDTIGNTHGSRNDRPLAGRIDNVRLYRAVLPADAIEVIRQADLDNTISPIR